MNASAAAIFDELGTKKMNRGLGIAAAPFGLLTGCSELVMLSQSLVSQV
jgi:hypothetical protein